MLTEKCRLVFFYFLFFVFWIDKGRLGWNGCECDGDINGVGRNERIVILNLLYLYSQRYVGV